MTKITKIIPSVIMDFWDIEKEFNTACENNDFEKINELLKSKDSFVRDTVYRQDTYNNPLIICIQNGNLEMLKYLTSSPHLEKHFDINKDIHHLFNHACNVGEIDIIDYLLNNPEIQFQTRYEGLISKGINITAKNGHLNTLKYFRNLPREEREVYEIEAENSYILNEACVQNHLSMVKYLFEEPKIIYYKDKIKDLEHAFEIATKKKHLDILKFFIFDLNIPQNDTIKQYLRYLPIEERDVIHKCFEIREVNQSLTNELTTNSSAKNKKLKV